MMLQSCIGDSRRARQKSSVFAICTQFLRRKTKRVSYSTSGVPTQMSDFTRTEAFLSPRLSETANRSERSVWILLPQQPLVVVWAGRRLSIPRWCFECKSLYSTSTSKKKKKKKKISCLLFTDWSAPVAFR